MSFVAPSRSRSPCRNPPGPNHASITQSALNVVCNHDAVATVMEQNAIIQELKSKVEEQQEEIKEKSLEIRVSESHIRKQHWHLSRLANILSDPQRQRMGQAQLEWRIQRARKIASEALEWVGAEAELSD